MRWRTAFTGLLVILLAAPVLASGFSDVPEDHPRAEAIRYVQAEGLFEGFEDGSFRPDEELTEGQFIRVVGRLHKEHPELTRGEWARIIHSGLPALPSTTTTAPATTLREAPAAVAVPVSDCPEVPVTSSPLDWASDTLPPTIVVADCAGPVPEDFGMRLRWGNAAPGHYRLDYEVNRPSGIAWEMDYFLPGGKKRKNGPSDNAYERVDAIQGPIPEAATHLEIRMIANIGAADGSLASEATITGYARLNVATGATSWEVWVHGGAVYRSAGEKVPLPDDPPPPLAEEDRPTIGLKLVALTRDRFELHWTVDPPDTTIFCSTRWFFRPERSAYAPPVPVNRSCEGGAGKGIFRGGIPGDGDNDELYALDLIIEAVQPGRTYYTHPDMLFPVEPVTSDTKILRWRNVRWTLWKDEVCFVNPDRYCYQREELL